MDVSATMGRQLGWLAAAWIAACVSTSVPEPAHGSPLSPQTEAAPVMPVATSLTHDPLATAPPLPPPAHHEHEHHHEHAAPEHSAADGGGMEGTAASDVYVCPMHPDVRQSTPGSCPRCGMKLVPAPKPAPKPQSHEHHGE